MNEADWDRSTDPTPLLQFLRDSGTVSDRKLWLFAAACCRRIWPLLADERGRQAVGLTERFADGRTAVEEWRSAGVEAREVADRTQAVAALTEAPPHTWAAAWTEAFACQAVAACAEAPPTCAIEASLAARYAVGDQHSQEAAEQATLLRCIVRNPFAPMPVIDPSLLSWSEGLVTKLARAAYEGRRLPAGTFDEARLAVLADALEDAGCKDAEVPNHLRGPGIHVRGCWAVDLLLGQS